MESNGKEEFVILFGLIAWLVEKEQENTDSLFDAYKKTGDKMYELFVRNKFYRFYKVLTSDNGNRISNLPDGISIIVKFLQSIKSNEYLICEAYVQALRSLDLILCIPDGANSPLYKVDVTPNDALYREIESILNTFPVNSVLEDLVEFYLLSLLRRWGNPKIHISTILKMSVFQTAKFEQLEFSDIQFNVVLKRNMPQKIPNRVIADELKRLKNALFDKQKDLSKCSKNLEKISKDNKNLKDELEKANVRIKNLELKMNNELKPEQEIPITRTRNNVLKIIAILADMADLSDQPYTAFSMMEAHARLKNLDIPSKTPVAEWLRQARDSN
ncbi:hypothetical protein [Acinetobacter gyllenbergii]|uniref:hypothetical protein n=1 Tax=Acinetobacter gyllenbergii TaxID=134534 RepID=UPI00241CB8DF|nr:hypothetical protein [Acinetobacter gyllenbergii]